MSNTRPTVIPASTSIPRQRVGPATRSSATKSRSPAPLRRNPLIPADPFGPAASSPNNSATPKTVKRKKSAASLHHRATLTPSTNNANDLVDRGTKLRLGSVADATQVIPAPKTTRRREKSTSSSASAGELALPPVATVPNSEVEMMKQEVEMLRQALQESKKQNKKHAKHIQELKIESSASKLMQKDQEAHIITLQTQNRASDELITNIESSLACQICMEMLAKPYALSPCGHVLCVGCLQEWFRKAPPSADDMDIDAEDLQNDPYYLMQREKTCPCCRAVVTRKPAPVFLIKSIASAVSKFRIKEPRAVTPPSDPEEDPWKGLFMETDEEDLDEDEDYSEYSEEQDDEDDEPRGIARLYGGLNYLYPGLVPHAYGDTYFSEDEVDMDEGGSEDDLEEAFDEEEEVLVAPRWQPPSVPWDEMPRNIPHSARPMIRRGCLEAMINIFGMEYTRGQGLIAYVTSLDRNHWEPAFMHSLPNREGRRTAYRLFLGWNLELAHWDVDGRGYIGGYLDDLESHPERYTVEPRGRRMLSDVRQFVTAGLDEDYDSVDSDEFE